MDKDNNILEQHNINIWTDYYFKLNKKLIHSIHPRNSAQIQAVLFFEEVFTHGMNETLILAQNLWRIIRNEIGDLNGQTMYMYAIMQAKSLNSDNFCFFGRR